MEYIDRLFYRQLNPSDFKKLYDIDIPSTGGGQTYLEAAGIDYKKLVDFLEYAEIKDSATRSEKRPIMTIYAHVLGNSTLADFLEFAPRNNRNNYKISRQNMKNKHPAWTISNGFPEPKKNSDGEYTSDGNFEGIIDNLIIMIFRTTYKKYYASYINMSEKPDVWPSGIGLETIFQNDARRGILSFVDKSVEFVDNKDNPFGNVSEYPHLRFDSGLNSSLSRNRIYFGAPGVGKSFKLNIDAKELLGDNMLSNLERVTFHPDYSFANFVGTYKPVPVVTADEESPITYRFVPGPFMRILSKALKNAQSNDTQPFLLIVEEINRANVAAVFGDVFQLLDRNDNNTSEYAIQTSEDVRTYLADELNLTPDECAQIKLPDNLFVWATMNSADQGVFPMDTAFKRRWDFTYIGIDDNDHDLQGKYVLLGKDGTQKVEWNQLRRAINCFLSNQKVNEDKQLGPYFLSRKIIIPKNGDEIDRETFIKAFKNKVIMYLFEDAAKQKRSDVFRGCDFSNRYSIICKDFDEKGIKIFHQDIVDATDCEDLTSGQNGTEGS